MTNANLLHVSVLGVPSSGSLSGQRNTIPTGQSRYYIALIGVIKIHKINRHKVTMLRLRERWE